jgi:phosphoserine phosphatase
MTHEDAQTEVFTGLVLLTGIDKPGIAASLFETLSPFAVRVIDIEQIVINHRLILTVLLGANSAHQSAIEDDLTACALALDVDIATLFTKSNLAVTPSELMTVRVSSPKLVPSDLALLADAISQVHGNIERIQRITAEPVSIEFVVSGVEKEELSDLLSKISFENLTETSVTE